MQVNKIQSTNNDFKKQNTPSFNGLYFRTPEVKEAVTRMPQFVEFLKVDNVKELVKKFNIVITDYASEDIVEYVDVLKKTAEQKIVPVAKSVKTRFLEFLGLKEKTPNNETVTIEQSYSEPVKKVIGREPLNDFYFRSCIGIDVINDEVVPSGLYTPLEQASEIGCWDGPNLKYDLILLKSNEQFEKLKFSTPEEKEKFLNTGQAYELLSNEKINKLLADGKKIVITDGEKCSFYIANDTKEENGIVSPHGFRTREYKSVYRFDLEFHLGYFDKEKGFNKIFFPNDEIKEKFLNSKKAELLLFVPNLEKITDKFNLFVTECDGHNYNYCLSTDLAIQGDTVIPAGFVTPTYHTKESDVILDVLKNHLEFIMDVNGLAANSDMEEKLDV